MPVTADGHFGPAAQMQGNDPDLANLILPDIPRSLQGILKINRGRCRNRG